MLVSKLYAQTSDKWSAELRMVLFVCGKGPDNESQAYGVNEGTTLVVTAGKSDGRNSRKGGTKEGIQERSGGHQNN